MTAPADPAAPGYRLTPLAAQGPGLPRLLHGMTTARNRLRLLRRFAEVGAEVLVALPRDLLSAPGNSIRRQEDGRRAPPDPARLALYVHYTASGRVSGMVLRQLDLLHEAGFGVAFVSMAAGIPAADWQAVLDRSAVAVQRRNTGYDFGTWKELLGPLTERWPGLGELLLMNDSVLGPLRPLGPVLAAMAAGGEGLFGLTDSLQGGAHLQSYFLLLRGRAILADFADFLRQFRPSHSKWLTVQRGELRLSGFMHDRGHRVAALFGYAGLVASVLGQPQTRAELAAVHPALRRLGALSPAERAALLLRQPLNPTHHLWLPLVRDHDFPFIKTDLVRRNPARLPGVADWPALVGAASPCDAVLLAEHLDIMKHPTSPGRWFASRLVV